MKALPEISESAGGYYTDAPLKLFGSNGDGDPIVTETDVMFNGDASVNLDHETFRIKLNKINNDFCKTDRKPYDMAVCVCLLAMKNNVPTFKLSSDGNMNDWKQALDLYQKVIGPVSLSLRT